MTKKKRSLITKKEDLNNRKDKRNKNNHIIVCPPEMKIETVIDNDVTKTNYFVQHLYFDNHGKLDDFIDHQNNMYIQNNDYKTRKSICAKLYATYPTHDFVWSNQSFTALANSLFRVMVVYLPESSYNNKARKTLDDYYPRALQWCSPDEQPIDLVNIDICKTYLIILRRFQYTKFMIVLNNLKEKQKWTMILEFIIPN